MQKRTLLTFHLASRLEIIVFGFNHLQSIIPGRLEFLNFMVSKFRFFNGAPSHDHGTTFILQFLVLLLRSLLTRYSSWMCSSHCHRRWIYLPWSDCCHPRSLQGHRSGLYRGYLHRRKSWGSKFVAVGSFFWLTLLQFTNYTVPGPAVASC
jgi:hypothetical protein